MKDQKQQKIGDVLTQIFKPEGYDTQRSLQKLNGCGGILSLINHLKTCHRRGLSSNDVVDHEKRLQQFGKNKAPHGQGIFKKSILEERDFIINFLFYLLTLRICVKILLFRDEIRGLKPLGQQVFHLKISAQLISYLLLIGIILLKARVSVQYYKMDQDERKYKNQRITVKRDGQIQTIYEQNLMVGDILVVQANSTIRIDGIVIKSRNFIVSQAHTVLRQDTKSKKQVWSINSVQQVSKDDDPFVLAGSYVITGSGQILVCTVGPNCSFRVDKQNKGYYNQYTPTIAQIKKIMNLVQNTAKLLTIFLATCKSIQYLYQKYEDVQDMTWIDLLYVLKVYCGFIGLICFVQRLKILKSLQFFIQANRSNKYFRIKNRATMEQLSKLQILFIQAKTLAVNKFYDREEEKIQLDHIAEISELNNFCQIKIITPDNRQRVAQIFGTDISYHSFFQPNQEITYSNHVKSLVEATFLTQTSASIFINEYLPIYRALKYEVGYIYDSDNQNNRDMPPEVLQIAFQKLKVNTMQIRQKLSIQANDNSSTAASSNNTSFWVKIQNKMFMEDVLLNIFMKSHIYASLFNTYMALFVNNISVFIVLCWFSTFVKIINLSWYLLIIIAHRYLFFIVYSRTTKYQRISSTRQNSSMQIFKLNMFLFPYYLYVANRLHFISSLFVFFLVNGMLRIQVILLKKLPLEKFQLAKSLGKYLIVYLLTKSLVIYMEKDEENFIEEQLKELKYTGGLVFIYLGYAIFF